ncbi:MAG TPA: hypothetical protein VNC84_04515 [Gammaproteobacteria bacterium]|nr:hypothetical protein [Gammaproteobacteria bacterium]
MPATAHERSLLSRTAFFIDNKIAEDVWSFNWLIAQLAGLAFAFPLGILFGFATWGAYVFDVDENVGAIKGVFIAVCRCLFSLPYFILQGLMLAIRSALRGGLIGRIKDRGLGAVYAEMSSEFIEDENLLNFGEREEEEWYFLLAPARALLYTIYSALVIITSFIAIAMVCATLLLFAIPMGIRNGFRDTLPRITMENVILAPFLLIFNVVTSLLSAVFMSVGLALYFAGQMNMSQRDVASAEEFQPSNDSDNLPPVLRHRYMYDMVYRAFRAIETDERVKAANNRNLRDSTPTPLFIGAELRILCRKIFACMFFIHSSVERRRKAERDGSYQDRVKSRSREFYSGNSFKSSYVVSWGALRKTQAKARAALLEHSARPINIDDRWGFHGKANSLSVRFWRKYDALRRTCIQLVTQWERAKTRRHTG